ncbi:MAG: hypothetical protein KA998_00190 [Rickettsiaceae bacterium]|nr:hypothetical protein [Rickettsiaceae bacterium]
MSQISKTIFDKINELEKQKEQLLLMRKEEIFEVVKASGGMAIDNRLLAGFILYALSPENKTDEFLQRMKDLGEKAKFPSKRGWCREG